MHLLVQRTDLDDPKWAYDKKLHEHIKYIHLSILLGNFCPVAAWGIVELMQWLRSEDIEWDEEMCSFAAGAGQLAMLQYLRAEGCPWDKEECEEMASRNNHHEVQQWCSAQ